MSGLRPHIVLGHRVILLQQYDVVFVGSIESSLRRLLIGP